MSAEPGRIPTAAGAGGVAALTAPATAASAPVARCPHCGAAVEGGEDAFCCAGCEMAASIIRGAGLERYYEVRETEAPRPEPLGGGWEAVPLEPDGAGQCTARLAIDGLRCASCVWVTENVLERTVGVSSAMVSYATGRATLRFDPARATLAELAGRIAALGYRPRVLGQESEPDRDLLVRLGVASFAAMNVMLVSAALYAGWVDPMEARFAALFRWIALVLATPVALWCSAPFFVGAWRGLQAGLLHMDVPIAIAVAVLWVQGSVGTLLGAETYLDSLTMLVALLLAGRLLEARGRRRSSEAAVTLAATVPSTARRIEPLEGGASIGSEGSVDPEGDRPTTLRTVASAELRRGDRIAVGAGEELPADGIVESGTGALHVALLTGESQPVAVGPGDDVWAGTVLEEGALVVRVDAVVGDTVVGRMAEELRRAADRGVRALGGDRIAPWFTGATLATALGTFVAWSLTVTPGAGLTAAVAVLVVACPCALALSKPLAASAGLGAAARRGLLLRSAEALLDLADVDVVVLDKTGTVTGGTQRVVSASDADVRIAAGLERHSRHPVALAIVSEAVHRGIPIPSSVDVREQAGVGISGSVDGTRWRLRSGGAGLVVLEDPHGYRGLIRLGDRIRSDSADAVSRLRALGLGVSLLSGDVTPIARRVGDRIGVRDIEAGVPADDKPRRIERLRSRGARVLFVGDGLNDGPALAVADVGIAMGGGAASSVLAADGVLAVGSLGPLAAGVAAARAAKRAVRANQRRSIVYNVMAVTAAAAGLVNPLVAAVLMPLSSGLVIWGTSRIEAEVRAWERAA